jgi:hypothetical protein
MAVAAALLVAVASCERATPEATITIEPAGWGEGHEKAAPGEGHEALRLRDHGEGTAETSATDPSATTLAERVVLGAEAPADVETVDAADILRSPEQYRGKTVRVSGTVKGYCHHARAWFAIDVPGASPPYLRFVTQPAFAVPEGCMGALATAHGTVELVETPRERVDHFEGEHRLGSAAGEAEGETVVRPIIRAAGAVFEPPQTR